MWLATDCSIDDVQNWLDSQDKENLGKFLGKRHEERFFGPIDCLKEAAHTYDGYGFSMMSLCCLLVETFQCYREGVPTTNKREWRRLLDIQNAGSVPQEYKLQGQDPPINGEAAFKNFFERYPNNFPNLDGVSFYRYIRNGLLHQAQTKGGWKINIKHSSVWDPASSSINRDLFAEALKSCFDAYLKDLEQAGWRDELWKNAARKIWWLIRISRP